MRGGKSSANLDPEVAGSATRRRPGASQAKPRSPGWLDAARTTEARAPRPPSTTSSTLANALPPGTRVSRYEILELIGAGEVAATYRARDPDLARIVALEVIDVRSPDSAASPERQDRILDAAQASARLSHPNLAAIYDVGLHEGAVFVVTEFIAGVSLRDWLAQPRSHREILRVLLAAGRGLAAAHAASVVHCHFNPDRVMLSDDGRVRVLEFGLARADAAADADLGGASSYVAPEVRLGAPSDEPSDQFSYAGTAFFALTGLEPTAHGPTADDLEGERRPRWHRAVPRKLRVSIDRGLSMRVSQRHPSVAALLAELEQVASPRRRTSTASALLLLLVAGVAAPSDVPQAEGRRRLCNVDDAAFQGVWDPTRRKTVEAAFLSTGRGNAAEAFQLVAGRLDAFTTEWLALRRASCEATHIRRDQPERILALRATCLNRQLEAARALVSTLTSVGPADVDQLAGAAAPPLSGCSDVSRLTGAPALPADPTLRARLEEIEIGLAVTRTLIAAARGEESIRRAREVLELARATEHQPAIAWATAELARATYAAAATNEQRSAASAQLKSALQLAARVGDDALLSRASSYLFYATAYVEGMAPEGEAMLPMVEALLISGGNRPNERLEAMIGKASILGQHLELNEAIQVLGEAIELASSGDEQLQRFVINLAVDQSRIYVELGQHEAGMAAAQRAVDVIRHVYGANHPRLLFGLSNLATMQARAGRRDLALSNIADLHRLAAVMPPEEPRLRNIPFAEGTVWEYTGDCERAIPFFREAVGRFTASFGASHSLTLDVSYHLGKCLVASHHLREGISQLEEVLRSRRNRDTPTAVAEAAFHSSQALWQLPSQRARSLSLAEEALSLYQKEGNTTEADDVSRWLAAHRVERWPTTPRARPIRRYDR